MAGALRPAEGRNFPTLPRDSSLNSFLYPMPIMLSETLAFHGHGGIFAACRMRCIRKNRKKRHHGENIFSPCRFSVLSCPWKHFSVFHVSCGNLLIFPNTIFAKWSPEDDILWCGVQGPRRPLPSRFVFPRKEHSTCVKFPFPCSRKK